MVAPESRNLGILSTISRDFSKFPKLIPLQRARPKWIATPASRVVFWDPLGAPARRGVYPGGHLWKRGPRFGHPWGNGGPIWATSGKMGAHFGPLLGKGVPIWVTSGKMGAHFGPLLGKGAPIWVTSGKWGQVWVTFSLSVGRGTPPRSHGSTGKRFPHLRTPSGNNKKVTRDPQAK